MFRFSVDAGKRSTDALPPVGGAQQSQVAVGGTESLPEWRRRRLGSSQHLCVQKQVGENAGTGQVEVFSKETVSMLKRGIHISQKRSKKPK